MDCLLLICIKLVNIEKYRYTLITCRLRVSSHRLEIQAGRWHRPNEIHIRI